MWNYKKLDLRLSSVAIRKFMSFEIWNILNYTKATTIIKISFLHSLLSRCRARRRGNNLEMKTTCKFKFHYANVYFISFLFISCSTWQFLREISHFLVLKYFQKIVAPASKIMILISLWNCWGIKNGNKFSSTSHKKISNSVD